MEDLAFYDEDSITLKVPEYVCPVCGDIENNIIEVFIKGMEAKYCLKCLVKHYEEVLQHVKPKKGD